MRAFCLTMKIEIPDELYEEYLGQVLGGASGDMAEHLLQLVAENALRWALPKNRTSGFEKDDLTKCRTYRQLKFDLKTDLFGSGYDDHSAFTARFLCVNIQNFKTYNDFHSLPKGDKALVEIATLLQSAYPERRMYRFSGDKFVIDLGQNLARPVESILDIVLEYSELIVNVDRQNRKKLDYIEKAIFFALDEAMMNVSVEIDRYFYRYPSQLIQSDLTTEYKE